MIKNVKVTREQKKQRKRTGSVQDLNFEKLEPRQMLAPLIDQVLVSGTDWQEGFTTRLEADGLGTNEGYSLTNDPSGVVPWANIDQISVQFSENVSVAAGDLVGQGINAGALAVPSADGFTYDSESFIATWTFNNSFATDSYTFGLAATITNNMNVGIEGELAFSLNLVRSDVDRSGVTNVLDGLDIRGRLFSNTGNTERYSVFSDVDGSGSINVLDGLNTREYLFERLPESQDTTGPDLVATLVNDTGESNSDGITTDPSISGSVSDPAGVASLTAGLNDAALADFQSVTLESDGSFSLSLADLEALAGVLLADGTHRLRLIASDNLGNESQTEIEFELDRAAPSIVFTPAAFSSDTTEFLDIAYSETLDSSAIDPASYILTARGGPLDGQVIPIQSVTQLDATNYRLNIGEVLPDANFRLTFNSQTRRSCGKCIAARTAC